MSKHFLRMNLQMSGLAKLDIELIRLCNNVPISSTHWPISTTFYLISSDDVVSGWGREARMVKHSNGIEINGNGRRVKSGEVRQNGHGNGHHMTQVTQWKITRVFSEHDEALINRRLPKELLLRVFSYLDVVSLCRSAQVTLACKANLKSAGKLKLW